MENVKMYKHGKADWIILEQNDQRIILSTKQAETLGKSLVIKARAIEEAKR